MKTSISIRTILVFLCFCFVMLPLVACEEKKANTNTNTALHYPITESEAIAKAKTWFTLTGEDKLAEKFGFISHYSPDIGSVETSRTVHSIHQIQLYGGGTVEFDCWKVQIMGI